jgi:hypothetical protein
MGQETKVAITFNLIGSWWPRAAGFRNMRMKSSWLACVRSGFKQQRATLPCFAVHW